MRPLLGVLAALACRAVHAAGKPDAHGGHGRDKLGQILFLNLDSRTDRLAHMEEQLQATAKGLPYQRVSATQTTWEEAHSKPPYKELLRTEDMQGYLKKDETIRDFVVSCRLSHMTTWQAIAEGKYGRDTWTLVLEDDVFMAPKWRDAVATGMAHVPSNFDIVRVDTWGEVAEDEKVWSDGKVTVYRAMHQTNDRSYYMGAHACLLQPSTAGHVLKFINSLTLKDIDADLSTRELQSYVIIADVIKVLGADVTGSIASDHPQLDADGNTVRPVAASLPLAEASALQPTADASEPAASIAAAAAEQQAEGARPSDDAPAPAAIVGDGLASAALLPVALQVDGGVATPEAGDPAAVGTDVTVLLASMTGSKKARWCSQVIYINLDARQDRRSHMEQQLQRELGTRVPWARSAAVETTWQQAKSDPALAPLFRTENGRDYLRDDQGHDVMDSKRAQFVLSVRLSHMHVWKRVAAGELGAGNVLVLEDDAILRPMWLEKVAIGLEHVPKDWEVIRIDTWGAVHEDELVWSDESQGIRVYRAMSIVQGASGKISYHGAHATIVRQQSAPHLLNFVNSLPLADVDGCLVTRELNSYVIQAHAIEAADVQELASDHPN